MERAEGSADEAHSSHTGHLSWIFAGVMGLVVVGESGWIAWRRRRRDLHPGAVRPS
ncbi:MAG: hypothetical protein HY905_16140 [Deltaproteobacteria bacterium]|nr:hypothetical protein [Deltaproteobacteria bacterium]